MPIGLSLHIGINHPDPSAYPGGWEDLGSCEKVAAAMAQLAASQGFWTRSLLTKEATASNILRNIESAALALNPGDIFLLTYAGHGSQIPDENGDEEDGFDETWVGYDRMIVDDELFFLWSRFRPRTRILVVSDSCHSGTIISVPQFGIADVARAPCKEAPALLATEVALELFSRNKAFYQAVQQRAATVSLDNTVLSMTACQDDELAIFDSCQGGLFTKALLNVWSSGEFEGDYFSFFSELSKLYATDMRNPRYRAIGIPNYIFESQRPFTI